MSINIRSPNSKQLTKRARCLNTLRHFSHILMTASKTKRKQSKAWFPGTLQHEFEQQTRGQQKNQSTQRTLLFHFHMQLRFAQPLTICHGRHVQGTFLRRLLKGSCEQPTSDTATSQTPAGHKSASKKIILSNHGTDTSMIY